jgi:alkylation response protein AidB-like acyl-CoA dehydrogenase
MTFELSAEHAAVRDTARAYAESTREQAAAIDRAAQVPEGLTREVRALAPGDALGLIVAVEEIAVVSAALATHVAAATSGAALRLSGLRGAVELDRSPRAQLALAGVALGLGRAALEAGVAALRQSGTAGGEIEKPHWVVSDVATEIEAARLLTYKAARTCSDADVAVARLMATAAAARAAEAAVRIVGSDAIGEGHPIERVSRDVRALSVLLGTEEEQRAIAADRLFPH